MALLFICQYKYFKESKTNKRTPPAGGLFESLSKYKIKQPNWLFYFVRGEGGTISELKWKKGLMKNNKQTFQANCALAVSI